MKKLKIAVKDKTGTALRISLKIFDGNDLPHELLLTTSHCENEEMHLITKCHLIYIFLKLKLLK